MASCTGQNNVLLVATTKTRNTFKIFLSPTCALPNKFKKITKLPVLVVGNKNIFHVLFLRLHLALCILPYSSSWCLAGYTVMHAWQIGPTDTSTPCLGSPHWACICILQHLALEWACFPVPVHCGVSTKMAECFTLWFFPITCNKYLIQGNLRVSFYNIKWRLKLIGFEVKEISSCQFNDKVSAS